MHPVQFRLIDLSLATANHLPQPLNRMASKHQFWKRRNRQKYCIKGFQNECHLNRFPHVALLLFCHSRTPIEATDQKVCKPMFIESIADDDQLLAEVRIFFENAPYLNVYAFIIMYAVLKVVRSLARSWYFCSGERTFGHTWNTFFCTRAVGFREE